MRPFLACLLAIPALAADTTQVSIAPVSLTFTQQTALAGSIIQGVVLASPQSSTFTVTKPASAPWLLLPSGGTTYSGVLPNTVPIAVNSTGMSAGTYTTSLTFQTPTGSIPVKVTLLVTGLPVLGVGPIGVVVFDGTTGDFLDTVSIGISNPNVPLLISSSTTTPWLSTRYSGSTVQVTADPSKVPGDIATGSVEVRSTANVGNKPLVIPVVFLRKGLSSQGPNITRMVNAATYVDSTGIAPGEIVTIGGTAIGPSSPAGLALNQDGSVSNQIGGVQVLFNGIPGPMVYAGPNLVSAVAPYELAGDTASVQVVNNGVGSNVLSVPVAAAAPGIFSANSSGTGSGAILNQDGSVNSPANPAAKGSAVVVYATGEGQTMPQGITGAVTQASSTPPITPAPAQPVTAQIDGQQADVLFAGEAPKFVSGVMQVNLQVPQNARSGDLPVSISVGGISSQTGITVSVR